ncbi:MAG: hypothetical protein L3J36_01305 [Rhodobacteraceae bacterium]|nr:hypothetical protein [Paracoccaceae bacterium]
MALTDYFSGAGRDNLQGGAGCDVIYADPGNDRIKGGSGDDVFVFNDVAWEHLNVIADFEDGIDKIRVTNHSGFDAIPITAQNAGSDTLIVLSGGTKVMLKGVDTGLIDINDFELL